MIDYLQIKFCIIPVFIQQLMLNWFFLRWLPTETIGTKMRNSLKSLLNKTGLQAINLTEILTE